MNLKNRAIATCALSLIGVAGLASPAAATARSFSAGSCSVWAEALTPQSWQPKGYTQSWGGVPNPNCKNMAIATVYVNSSGVTARTVYVRVSPGPGFNAIASPIPNGATYVRGQLEICPTTGSCKTYAVNP